MAKNIERLEAFGKIKGECSRSVFGESTPNVVLWRSGGPAHVLTEREACRDYLLTPRRLREVSVPYTVRRTGKFGGDGDSDTRMYAHFDIQDASLELWGSGTAIDQV